jgi:hypothetical protein
MPARLSRGSVDAVSMWIVERYLAGWSAAEISALVQRVVARSEVFDVTGVRHIRSIMIPEDETCFCLFEAADAASVLAANEAADLPCHRVVAAEETKTELEPRT